MNRNAAVDKRLKMKEDKKERKIFEKVKTFVKR